jgi:hypothetical protein
LTGETGLSLARRAAWTVVNAATSSMAWPTVRQRLVLLLSRPGDERDQDLQRRLDRTQERMNESSRPAGSGGGVAAEAWHEQVQQWTDLFRGVLDDRPELAGGLAELLEELTARFGLPWDQPAPGDPATPAYPPAPSRWRPGSPPSRGYGSPPPAAPAAAPPDRREDTGSFGRRGSPPGASFGDDDDLDE